MKRGIKVWECADPSNSFVCYTSVYTGRHDGNPEQGLRYCVAYNLTRTLVGKNHHVFVDNFFNSVALAEDITRTDLHLWNYLVKSPRHSKGNWAFCAKSETSLSGRIFVSLEKKCCCFCLKGQKACVLFKNPM